MNIITAQFVKSSPALKDCPKADMPEFAFIGRSNVGKSSLLNMITGFNKLAKTSGQPGKTQTINHFIINDNWYLADLPGYGYAKVSKKKREEWNKATVNYIVKRTNLVCLFVLIDSRLEPQTIDLSFMEMVGMNGVPFCMVYTKSDKLTKGKLKSQLANYEKAMLEKWETLPASFITSAVSAEGREELLNYVSQLIDSYQYGAVD